MRCTCGFTVPFTKAPTGHSCFTCGQTLAYDTDDYLLHGAGDLVREIRPGQVQMGRLVEDVLSKNQFGVIEGPVGIGKSFGYAIPALLSGKRTIISTAKKQLQHQLAGKDFPLLNDKLGKDVQVALLKGKSNYACRVRVFDIPAQERKSFLEWLDESEYGDLTDYPGRRPFFWGDVTAEDCVGDRCRFSADCGYWRAKTRMKTAQVVVANHHVVAFDLRFGPYKLLGPYGALIIDEAHQAPGAFRSAYALTITPNGVKRIIKRIDNAGLNTGLEAQLESTWADMFKQVAYLDGEVPKDPFGDAGREAIKILSALRLVIRKEMLEAGYVPESRRGSSNIDWETITKLEMIRKAVDRPLDALVAAEEPDDNTVIYVTTAARGFKTVSVAPISVGPVLGPKLQQIDSVLLTSATLAVNRSFDDIKSQLGFDWKPPQGTEAKPVAEAILDSPFDYNRQALLYTPKHIPLPESMTAPEDRREAYLEALTREVGRLITASAGNAFILFSSTLDLQAVHQRLIDDEEIELPLIPQGDDAEAALRTFLSTPNSTILGLKSFWEGVDVVGDKLRLVVIAKLPFPMVSDPVIQARSRQLKCRLTERGMSAQAAEGQVFQAIQIPQMLTDLRQGVGRLIRSRTDKGVCAILDSRVWTGSGKRAPTAQTRSYQGYGALAVNAVGYSQRVSDFAITAKFLNMLRTRN